MSSNPPPAFARDYIRTAQITSLGYMAAQLKTLPLPVNTTGHKLAAYIRKSFLILGVIALSACNIDNEKEEFDTLPKLCAKLKSKDLETDMNQSFDACRRLNLLNDFNDFKVIFDRYYVEPENIRYECLRNIKSFDYYSTYNERIGLKYKNIIEAVKSEYCLNKIKNYNDITEKTP